jgi:hypothetical protein
MSSQDRSTPGSGSGAVALLHRLDDSVAAGTAASSPSRRRRLLQQRREEQLRAAGLSSPTDALPRRRSQRADWPVPGDPTPSKRKRRSSRKHRAQPSLLRPVPADAPTPRHSRMAAWPPSTAGSHWLRSGPIRWWSVLLRVGTAAAFARWIALVEGSRHCIVIGAERIRFRMTQRAWYAFAERIAHRRHVNSLLHKCLVMARTSLEFVALHRWAEHCESERQRREGALRKAVGRMRLLYAAQAFVSWVSYTVRSQELDNVMYMAARLLHDNTLARSFDTWLDAADHIASVKAQAWPMWVDPDGSETELVSSISEAQRARCELLARQAVQRWVHPDVYAALQGWDDFVQQKMDARSKVKRVLARIGRRQLHEAFQGWDWAHAQAVHMRQIAKRAIVFMSRASLARAHMRWLNYTHESVRSKQLARKAIGQMSRSAAGRAYLRWIRYTAWSKVVKVSATRLVQKMRHRLKAKSLTTWQQYSARRAKSRTLLTRGLAKLRNTHLASAWQTWTTTVREIVRMRTIVGRIVMRMRNGVAMSAFVSWLDWTQERTRERKIIAKVVARLRRSELLGAFCRWQEHWSELDRTRGILLRHLVKVRNATVLSAWQTWTTAVKDSIRMRTIAGRVVSRLHNRLVVSAFASWLDWTQERTRERKIIAKVVARLRKVKVLGAFCRWQEHWSELDRNRGVLLKHLVKVRNATILSAWQTWTTTVKNSVHMHTIAGRVVSRLHNRLVVSAFASWHNLVTKRAHNRDIAYRALARLQRDELMVVFLGWIDFVHAAVSAEIVEEAALKREIWMIDTMFTAWKHVAARELALELVLEEAQVRIECILIRSAFDRWMDSLFVPDCAGDQKSDVDESTLLDATSDSGTVESTINGSWTPGSKVHKDWTWSQQLEFLQTRRAEQDWLGGSGPATAATPDMVADLVADLRETRLNHQAKLHEMHLELSKAPKAPETPRPAIESSSKLRQTAGEMNSWVESPMPRVQSTGQSFGSVRVSGDDTFATWRESETTPGNRAKRNRLSAGTGRSTDLTTSTTATAYVFEQLSADAAALVGDKSVLHEARLEAPRRGPSPPTRQEIARLQRDVHELQTPREALQASTKQEAPRRSSNELPDRPLSRKRAAGRDNSLTALLDDQAAAAGSLFRSSTTGIFEYERLKAPVRSSTSASGLSLSFGRRRTFSDEESVATAQDPLALVLQAQADLSAKLVAINALARG